MAKNSSSLLCVRVFEGEREIEKQKNNEKMEQLETYAFRWVVWLTLE